MRACTGSESVNVQIETDADVSAFSHLAVQFYKLFGVIRNSVSHRDDRVVQSYIGFIIGPVLIIVVTAICLPVTMYGSL